MASNELDLVDVAPLVALPVFSGMELNVWSFEVSVFGGYDFSQTLFSGAGIEVSAAMLLTLASIVAIILTNEIDGSNYEQYEYAGMAGALGIVPLTQLVPAVDTLVTSHDAIAFGVWVGIAVVSTWIAYTE